MLGQSGFKRIARELATLLLALCAGTAGAASGETAAEIVSLQGKGEYREAQEALWREAAVRQRLAQGNFVRTGDASRMAVLLADQTQVRLAPNSMIQIKQVGDNHDRGTVIKQSAGRSWTQSKNVPNLFNAPGQLIIETPSAVAAIRGTDWELVVDPDGASTLTVLSGEVQFSNDQGSISVRPGEQGRAQSGVAPVKRLLQNPRERVQWVSSFTVDASRYPELAKPGSGEIEAIAAALRAGDNAAARRSVERLNAERPGLAVASLLLADFQVMAGELTAALATLVDAGGRFPDDERFDVWRARLHLLRDEPAAARTAVAQARARKPLSVEALLVEGELERLEGNAAAALAAYGAAIAQAPTAASAWQGLGIVQSEREDVGPARESLGRALALEAQAPGLLGELGTLEAFADRLGEARAAFAQALEQRPDDYVALTGLGLVELKSAKTEEAITRLLAATLIEPRYARAQTYLAIAYYQQARVRDALFALSRARALDAKDPLPDLLESVIRNDLLQPGEALVTARRALALLPNLKSLNQVANDQKGGANLGSALAAFGLEDWARSYAQDSYYPFWAGSHLFLADRYSGDFNKKSELFQGFLADPTVFGASNRFSTLIARPGNYGTIEARYDHSRDFRLLEPTFSANGYANAGMPFAYFAEAIRTDTRPDRLAFDAGATTYTVALGARPSYELGLFVYANAFKADVALSPASGVQQLVAGDNQRLDLGAHYRFGPQSQAWLKLGQGSESSTVRGMSTIATNIGPASSASFFQTKPEQHDQQWRHSFQANEQQELSWGAEHARMEKRNTLVQEDFYHVGVGLVPSDRLDQHDRDQSRELWLSDRYRASEQLILQGDLAWAGYSKRRDIVVYRDRTPPLTQLLPESYDRTSVTPRLGAVYVLDPGLRLRAAYQKWLRPASYNALSPVATAGIPIDDGLVYPGGSLSRYRGQLDWEISPTWYVNAFADQRRVDNLASPLDGVQNTRADVANLDRLRQKTLANLAAPDQLEASPVFSRGKADSAGVTVNHVLSPQLAGYLGYTDTHGQNTSVAYAGKRLPYLPQQRATLGLTWAGDQRLILSAQAVWRSARFADEANQIGLPAGWEATLKLHWESADKRWSFEAYAANLFKKSVEDLFGVDLVLRF